MTRIFTIIGVVIGLFACGTSQSDEGESVSTLKIACAANMQFALDSIVVVFEEETGIHCEITSGSSGMLTAQIKNGAPYDLFVSANMSYPNTLYREGKGEEPFTYATGRLVLAVADKNRYGSLDEALSSDAINRIGFADAKTAPYGMAANAYLNAAGKMSEVKAKLVVGESIGQVNQYLTSNAVDAAFTSYSFKVKNEENFTYYEIDQKWFPPIQQGAMILTESTEKSNAEKFAKFLTTSEKCRSILIYFGYLVP